MEIIAKVSKGSKMDQIYLPKSRVGMIAGEYVIISPIQRKDEEISKNEIKTFKPFFRGIKEIEPLKLMIIKIIFKIAEKEEIDNVIITGSFLEKGFRFNDIDIILLSSKKNHTYLKEKLEKEPGIKIHLIEMDNAALLEGLETDPLYSMMLSRCISRKRLIFKQKRKINPKILDYQLLKSKTLIDNFDILNGEEKYYLTLNMISILLFIENKKLSKEEVDNYISKNLAEIKKIKYNLIGIDFIKKYKEIYKKTFNLILAKANE
jgi:hypothetical protein